MTTDRLITIPFTRDELTRLMHMAEVARDEASKAALRQLVARNPAYPQPRPETQEACIQAARNTLTSVSEICDRITDIWRENQ